MGKIGIREREAGCRIVEMRNREVRALTPRPFFHRTAASLIPDDVRINECILGDWSNVCICYANPAMTEAVLDCLWLDIGGPGSNSQTDGLQNIDLFRVYNLVLKALNQKPVEPAAVVGLEVPDNSSIAWLDLGRGFSPSFYNSLEASLLVYG